MLLVLKDIAMYIETIKLNGLSFRYVHSIFYFTYVTIILQIYLYPVHVVPVLYIFNSLWFSALHLLCFYQRCRFVELGKKLKHSPDGKMYMVEHGASSGVCKSGGSTEAKFTTLQCTVLRTQFFI